jgi:hypothetical protein
MENRVSDFAASVLHFDLFSNFASIDNPVISNFITSVPISFKETTEKLLSLFADPIVEDGSSKKNLILNNRIKLQKFIEKFHTKANTMTSSVSNTLNFLSDPETEILISLHQPNLFAYGGIFKKIVFLETLKDNTSKYIVNKKIVNLFVIVDHDFMDETWMRLAQLPSPMNASGILELRIPMNNSKRWLMVSNMPLPSTVVLDKWKNQIISWINSSAQHTSEEDKIRLRHNFDEFWYMVKDSYTKAEGYSDLNSFLMSQIVNKIWNYETLFVKLTDLTTVFEDGYRFLISNFNKYSEALRQASKTFLNKNMGNIGVSSNSYLYAPMWLHCKCGSKASAKVNKNTLDQVSISGKCISCKKDLNEELGDVKQLKFPKDALLNFSPRAIPLLLLLSRDLGMKTYCSGTGGIGYMAYASMAYKALSLKTPLIIFWPARDIYKGIGQQEALDILHVHNVSDVQGYISDLKQKHDDYSREITPIIEQRTQKTRAGQQINSILQDLFTLKEKQREIRRQIKVATKICNALELRPCIIDYIVNFGLMDTERLWRNNLITNDKLASPLIMSKE